MIAVSVLRSKTLKLLNSNLYILQNQLDIIQGESKMTIKISLFQTYWIGVISGFITAIILVYG